MRVLQLVHALPPAEYGGTELYTRSLAAELVERGHDVAVATPRGADAAVDGVTVFGLPTPERLADPDEGEAVPGGNGGVQDDRGFAAGGVGTAGTVADSSPDAAVGDEAVGDAELDLPDGDAEIAAAVVDEAVDARVADLVDRFDPDVAHLQHLKGLSAGIPAVCAERDVACVATLHDFWALCHREQLYRPEGARCSGPESVAKCTDCLYGEVTGTEVPGDAAEPELSDDAAEPADTETGPTQRDPDRLPGWHRSADAVARRTSRLRRALETADRLVAPSAFLRETFVRYGFDPAHVVHCRNGIDVDRFADSGFDPSTPLAVGYAGRIAPEKGVRLLVEAFDGLDGDATLEVFGAFDPTGNAFHRRLTEAAGGGARPGRTGATGSGSRPERTAATADRVRFHGRYDDPARPYREMDVLVLPSVWYENSPLVVQEAFAAGVPVVTADVGGMAELVNHGEDGLTFAVEDADALRAALQRLVDDPGLVERLRDGVAEPTRLSDHAEELLGVYDDCRAGREVRP